MLAKVLPVVLALLGTGAGVGAGIVLKKPADAEFVQIDPCGDVGDKHGTKEKNSDGKNKDGSHHEFVKLNNQFVVPVVTDEVVSALILLSVSLEVEYGGNETVFSLEPKLRDALLQEMFDHANMGGFRGAFTNSSNLDVLRMSLREAARSVAGDIVRDVLITDIARQDT
ncbi:flagellar basal body-associated FliL family protein [Shimia biformata]|uniref:flagellar basal body-associated FliL family protein n=1 Tax=Shimia biformata TaxID=1294299 RepID=UPI00195074E2|nr:flagellar basal body-associated FliL family protein [Shimia biformata]